MPSNVTARRNGCHLLSVWQSRTKGHQGAVTSPVPVNSCCIRAQLAECGSVRNNSGKFPDDPVAVCTAEYPVGTLLIAATDTAIVALEFTDPDNLVVRREQLFQRYLARIDPRHSLLVRLRHQLDEYFAGRLQQFDLPLQYPGSPFQQGVWHQLLQIPYGATWSYGELAGRLGDVNAMRAVGAANGANPIAIVIPCHRVINADGSLGGFGGGSWRKQLLLDLEGKQLQLGL